MYRQSSDNMGTQRTLDAYGSDGERSEGNTKTLKRIGFAGINNRGTDNRINDYSFSFHKFIKPIIETLDQTDHVLTGTLSVDSPDDLLTNDGYLSIPDDIRAVIRFVNSRMALPNRHGDAYIGNLKIGDERDGREIVNNKVISGSGESPQLGVPNPLVPTECNDPQIVNVWAGDGTIALERGGWKGGLYKKKCGQNPYGVNIGGDWATDFRRDINHLKQLRQSGLRGDSDEIDVSVPCGDTSDYRALTIDQSDTGANQTPTTDLSLDLGLTEREVKALGINPDAVSDTLDNVGEHILVEILPHPNYPDKYILRRADEDMTVEISPVTPDLKPRQSDFGRQDIIDAVRDAAQEKGEPLSAREYQEYQSEHNDCISTDQTMGGNDNHQIPNIDHIFRLWSFVGACEASGVDSRQKGQSKIEEIMQTILDELNIDYTMERKMGHRKNEYPSYQADFCINQSYIIIEVDGNYWHAHPDYYDPTDNTGDKGRHEAVIEKDEKRDDYLQDEGYHVVRVWGSTIKQQRDEVKNKISQILNGGDLPPNGSHVFGPEPEPESAIGGV